MSNDQGHSEDMISMITYGTCVLQNMNKLCTLATKDGRGHLKDIILIVTYVTYIHINLINNLPT